MADRFSYTPTDVRATFLARRVESLAETALSIAEAYEGTGRWASALALIDAVLRDPDLPGDRPALAARLKACRGRLLALEALYETNHFDAAIAALEEAVALGEAAGDLQIADLARDSLRQTLAFQAASAASAVDWRPSQAAGAAPAQQ